MEWGARLGWEDAFKQILEDDLLAFFLFLARCFIFYVAFFFFVSAGFPFFYLLSFFVRVGVRGV